MDAQHMARGPKMAVELGICCASSCFLDKCPLWMGKNISFWLLGKKKLGARYEIWVVHLCVRECSKQKLRLKPKFDKISPSLDLQFWAQVYPNTCRQIINFKSLQHLVNYNKSFPRISYSAVYWLNGKRLSNSFNVKEIRSINSILLVLFFLNVELQL